MHDKRNSRKDKSSASDKKKNKKIRRKKKYKPTVILSKKYTYIWLVCLWCGSGYLFIYYQRTSIPLSYTVESTIPLNIFIHPYFNVKILYVTNAHCVLTSNSLWASTIRTTLYIGPISTTHPPKEKNVMSVEPLYQQYGHHHDIVFLIYLV